MNGGLSLSEHPDITEFLGSGRELISYCWLQPWGWEGYKSRMGRVREQGEEQVSSHSNVLRITVEGD